MELIVILTWLLTFLVLIFIEIISWPIEIIVWIINFFADMISKIF